MKKMSAALIATLILVALFALGCAQPVAAAHCDVMYRIWQDGQNKPYYHYGDTILIKKGKTAHLYIHFKSRSKDPYSTAADIGAPADYGVGGQRTKDIQRVLRLGKKEPNRGKQEFQAIATGETALAYRIWGVKSPGKLDQIPARCRVGQVRITVVD